MLISTQTHNGEGRGAIHRNIFSWAHIYLIYLYTYIIYPLLSSIIRVMVRIYFMGAYLFNLFIHIYHISTSIIYYQSHGQDIFSWAHIYSIYLYIYLYIHIYIIDSLLSSIIRVMVRIYFHGRISI